MAPGVELSDIKWLAVGAAMLANIVLGFLWYNKKTPTGKVWLKHSGMDPDERPPAKVMALSMGLMLLGVFLTMFVLAHDFVAYRDAYRLDKAGYDLTVMDGVTGGFFTWLGFFLPVQLNIKAFSKAPWGLVLINAAYYLVALLVAGILLVVVP
jgi:hypothetical protein